MLLVLVWPSTGNAQPAAPSNLAYSSVSATTLTLQWQDNSSDETRFHIERAEYFVYDWTEIGTVAADVTTYEAEGLSPNFASYVFRVRAFRQSDSSYSGYAEGGTVTTMAALPGAAAFGGVTSDSITANWLANGNPVGTSYFCENTDTAESSGWTTATNWTNSPLVGGVTYAFRVKARNFNLDETAWVPLGSQATLVAGPDAPTNCALDLITESSLRVIWQDNASDEDGYAVQRWAGAAWVAAGTAAADAEQYTGAGTFALEPASPQRFRVRAYREGDGTVSDWSTSNETSLLPNAPVAAAFSEVTANQVRANWTSNGNHASAEYRAENTVLGVTSSWSAELSWLNTGLVAGATYAYRTQARNAFAQESDWTFLGQQATALPPPGGATGCYLDLVTASSVRVNWIDSSTDEDVFEVERQVFGEPSWSVVGTTPADLTSYSATGTTDLEPGTAHSFRVRAHRFADDQYSEYSNTASANTLVRPPVAQAFTGITASQITANWSPDGAPQFIDYLCENLTAGTNSGWISGSAWTSSGLSPTTAYTFRVKARNADEVETDWTALGQQSTLAPPPAAPTACDIVILSTNSLRVEWTDNAADESRFDVEHYLGAFWTLVGTVPADTTTYEATGTSGLQEGSPRRFRVRAYRQSDSQYSTYATSPLRHVWVSPPAPLELLAAGTHEILAQWQSDAAWGEAEFLCENVTQATDSGWIVSRLWVSTGLVPETTYTFRVKARNLDGIETDWVPLGSGSPQSLFPFTSVDKESLLYP